MHVIIECLLYMLPSVLNKLVFSLIFNFLLETVVKSYVYFRGVNMYVFYHTYYEVNFNNDLEFM